MFNKMKAVLASLIISILIFSTGVSAYDDIAQNSPYFYAVEYLRRNDVFQNSKLFKPDILISKAEFIKYLVLLNSPKFEPAPRVTLPFTDTSNNAWYAPYFKEAIKLGILFNKEEKINPYQKLTILNALELLYHSRGIPIPREYVGSIPYKDVKRNKRSQAIVMRSISLGVVSPEKSDFFGLYKRVTRAKAAHMIYKMDLVDLRDPGMSIGMTSFDLGLQKIINSWDLIKSNFVDRDELDDKELSNKAIKAMIETLDDPYSVYFDQTENQNFNDIIDGSFEGIGAFVAVDENENVIIVSPIQGSPAEKAGVEAGDIILKVDDYNAEGEPLHDVVNKIKGPKGTIVKLTFLRNGRKVIIPVTRGVINVNSTEYEVIGSGNIMHIKLINFNQIASGEFREIVEIISNNSKIKGVVLDMRNNPGGLLDVAIKMLGHLLPNESPAVQIKYNYFNLTQNTSGEGVLKDLPIVVLVNKGSASASEIVAGALQEVRGAPVIGETTFGKGTVQEVNYFGDDSSLKLTVAKWLTPYGKSINGNGITPNIEIKQGGAENEDRQLDRAILELKKLIK